MQKPLHDASTERTPNAELLLDDPLQVAPRVVLPRGLHKPQEKRYPLRRIQPRQKVLHRDGGPESPEDSLGHCVHGFLDDYQKVTRRQNEAGLTARAKILGQIVIAFGVALAIYFDPSFDAELSVPFFKDFTPHLGWLYVPLAALVIVGASNGVNLTDGLDGLAIGPVMITAGTFLLLSYAAGHARIADYLAIKYVAGADQIPIFCGALVGGGLAFLWFNAYPANLFMGDVGSLALGGALGTIAVLIRQEILLGVVGGVFVIETLSVAIQVAWFKLTGKRVFLMAPIHHHFEKMGWHEQTIVIRFWILSAILGLVALSSLKLR